MSQDTGIHTETQSDQRSRQGSARFHRLIRSVKVDAVCNASPPLVPLLLSVTTIAACRMSRFRTLALAALASACLAAEGGAAAQPPLPRSAPLAPVNTDVNLLDAEDRLLRDLELSARQRDERIQAILRTSSGARPIAAADLGSGLERPRSERDKALGDLREALQEWLGRTHRSDKDMLDPASPTRQAAQASPLSAENRIAIAECLRDLALESEPIDREQRLNEGLAEVEAMPNEMSEILRSRAAWLRVFFLAELARLPGDPAKRAEQATLARATAEGFAGSFPASELALAVAGLVADLPKAGP